MLSITRDKAIPVDLVADAFVEDEVYVLLGKNRGLREALLDSLGKEKACIDRLGMEKIPGITYEKSAAKIRVPDVSPRKEVGYYCRL